MGLSQHFITPPLQYSKCLNTDEAMVLGRMNGIIFSDRGQAASFMALEWVQQALKNSLGFIPFPATLNVRPKELGDARVWEKIQKECRGVPLPSTDGGFCSARLYSVEIQATVGSRLRKTKGAVLVPEVSGYPKDKIEIIAHMRLKDKFGLHDGDQLTLEFIN